ncbi:PEP-CTERM sorting domain-containing protein [Duganella sp. CY15W]|uniref:PEP-CTERM sorting domain-containing protein n=1 Tax=Duganella sp. CY15W TaxID=2692172 RepID=UPI00136FC6DC|nr:PEP-CTERM sorting domain-containing protein [Duganella sp. CY15W]MYM32332.1 PEP-CTERM sorting domain-containing protein [Duganella sp. CY15W]
MKIKFALKTAAIAAALVFSGASHAAIGYAPHVAGLVTDTHGTLLSGTASQGVSAYDLTGTSLGAQILAFCVEAKVAQGDGTVYTEHDKVNLSTLWSGATGNKVKALFETSYGTLLDGTTVEQKKKLLGFQLALWDLIEDDGDMYHGTTQKFSTGLTGNSGAYVATAQQMLTAASTHTLTNMYNYSTFTGVAGSTHSQNLLSVSAVPEADTWAMMAVGLGLIGFMGRRKSDESEKFAV